MMPCGVNRVLQKASVRETPAGIWAAIMNIRNMFLCRQSTAAKKFSLSLKVFIIMQKSILMERKPHTDHMVIQISM